MKKGFKTVVVVAFGALAAAVAIGATYHYSDGFKSWIAGNLGGGSESSQSSSGGGGSSSDSSSTDNSSSSASSSTTVGQFRVDFRNGPQFGVKRAATVGEVMPATATLLPANATDKNVLWTSSDITKVTVTTATVLSGVPNSLKLVAIYSGTVTVTLKAEADNSITSTFAVTCYNQLVAETYYGSNYAGTLAGGSQGNAGPVNYVSGAAKEYVGVTASQLDPQATPAPTASNFVYNVTNNAYYLGASLPYLDIEFQVYGYDTTRYPSFCDSLTFVSNVANHLDWSAASIDSVAVYGTNMSTFMPVAYDGIKKDFKVTESTTDKSATISLVFEYAGTGISTNSGASKALANITLALGAKTAEFNTLAYVAPASISNTGSILFN
jgi:hypothetical protein